MNRIRDARLARQRKRSAIRLAERGMHIVPLGVASKKPARGSSSKSPLLDVNSVREYVEIFPDNNYGIVTGSGSNLFVLDIDGLEGRASIKQLSRTHGKLPPTLTVQTRRGYHLYFKFEGDVVRNSASALGLGLDVRGEGGYVVGPYCLHPDGGRYRPSTGVSLITTPIVHAPDWLLSLVRERQRGNAGRQVRSIDSADEIVTTETAKVRRALEGSRNEQLNRSAYSVGRYLGDDPVARERARACMTSAARDAGLGDREINATFDSGYNAGASAFAFSKPSSEPVEDPLTEKLSKLGFTDTDNASRFVARYQGIVAYAPGTGWLIYDGVRWASDSLDKRRGFAIATAEKIADEAGYVTTADGSDRLKQSKLAKSAGAIERMISLAKHQLSIEDAQLDNNPLFLNVRNGTVDLQTGNLLPHCPEHYLTRVIDLDYDAEARCPYFKQFLSTVTRGDREFANYLRRAVGYCLTGITSEQVFFFVHGKGRNGKSTFVNLIRDMLGGYGCHTPTETLLVKQYDNAIPADLARLKGARMVTAAEANYNRQIDEAKIKAMTGGEPIAARHLRQDFFSFTPEFKLWMMANDFPRVRGTADAFWRRVQALPFDAEIAEVDIDPDLPKKLREELPGILAWAVRGTLAWRKEGLGTCSAVQSGNDRWKGFADHVARFLEEECQLEPGAIVASSQLMSRYQPWCTRNGEKPLTPAGMKAKLTELDLTHTRTRKGSFWKGLSLKT